MGLSSKPETPLRKRRPMIGGKALHRMLSKGKPSPTPRRGKKGSLLM